MKYERLRTRWYDHSTHGGTVNATQNMHRVDGRATLRVGDRFYCPQCKTISTLLGGHSLVMIFGKAVACIGDRFSCGARLVGNQKMAVMDTDARPLQALNRVIPNQSRFSPDPYLHKTALTNNLAEDEDEDEEKKVCPPECIVETVTFSTSLGDYIISKEAWEFILSFEGFESIPYVPKNSTSSGVTLGYGYDLGQQSPTQIQEDLASYYTSDQIKRLIKVAQGKKGDNARIVLAKISDIKISKEAASKMIIDVKQRYAQQVVDIYPEVLKLHPHCQGMLLDLIYNRGNSLKDRPKQLTRLHMRQIRDAFKEGSSEKIPDILREMSKLWAGKGLTGLVNRRKYEAKWFEKGLKCDCYK